jgi:hypothetical protein
VASEPNLVETEIEEAKPDPLDAARQLLAEDQQRRLDACHAEIQEVLAKHGMRLQITQPVVGIVPL